MHQMVFLFSYQIIKIDTVSMHDTQKVIRSDETIWPNGALKFNISKNSICGFSLHVSRPKKAHMHKFTSQQRNKATIKYLFRVKMSYSNQNNRLVSLVSQYGEILFSCVFIMDFFFLLNFIVTLPAIAVVCHCGYCVSDFQFNFHLSLIRFAVQLTKHHRE